MQQSKHLMETHTQHEGELKLRDRWNCSSWKLRSTAKFQERIRSVWIYWKNICVTPKEIQYLRWSYSINQNCNWTEIWRRSKETGIFKRAFSSISWGVCGDTHDETVKLISLEASQKLEMSTKRSSESLERRLEADTHIISSNERADKHDGLQKPRELEG